jgi:hypothetical protein
MNTKRELQPIRQILYTQIVNTKNLLSFLPLYILTLNDFMTQFISIPSLYSRSNSNKQINPISPYQQR